MWAASRQRDAIPVAIKVGRQGSPWIQERFRAEAAAIERIAPPHVPRLHGAGRLADGRPYLVMERLAGETLAARLAAREAPFAVTEVRVIAGALLAALEAAHAARLIHRDLKPENVFFAGSPPRATLVDFGLVQSMTTSGNLRLTRAGTILGTSEYMSPELLRGDAPVDLRVDLYAVGVMLYEMLTLRPPFVGDARSVEHGHLALRPPRPGAFAPIPEALEQIVLGCLAKDPERRPRSAGALRRALAVASSPARAGEEATASGLRPEASEIRATSPVTRGALASDRRQPAVVLVVETSGSAAPVLAVIAGHRGVVVRQRGQRYVGVFLGAGAEDPARAGLAAARELVALRARAALHLAPLAIHGRERGAPAVFGAAVNRPETWLPPEPWSGVSLSDELARVFRADGPPESAPATCAGDGLPALLGRDAELEALAAFGRAVFGSGEPGLFTVLGEAGLGKSALTAELALEARRLHPGALVFAIRASPSSAPLAPETASLLAWALLAPDAPPPDPRAWCALRLGHALGDEVGAAVAVALGWTDARAPRPESALLRAGVVRAIAAGLQRRAQGGPVAVIVDDGHWADDTLLDAIEYATLSGEGCPLWVLVAASPRFQQTRPSWGTRAQHHARVMLGPLSEGPAIELAARLILPAEYPPVALLARLAAWAGGNPLALSQIVLALKQAGLVRQRRDTGSFHVATAELDRIPLSPAWQWLAARQVEALPAELAAFVNLCAAIGADLSSEEIESVVDALEQAGAPGVLVDVHFGLATLVARGILCAEPGGRHVFQNALFHEAVYARIPAREREAIHRAALACARARLDQGAPLDEAPAALAALARHAAACGARATAAEAHLRLGDLSLDRHRYVEADQHYTAALSALDEDDDRGTSLALLGRGKSRLFLSRFDEAEADLGRACGKTGRLGDDALHAGALLELATALDWSWKYEESAARVEEAAARLGPAAPSRLQSRLLIARARTVARFSGDRGRGQLADAIPLFERALALAGEVGDHESRIIGLLLLPRLLQRVGRDAEAEAAFEEVIGLTGAAGDWAHLAAAYVNRVMLWTLRKLPERGLEDLRRAIELARRGGSPTLELAASYNAAELLHQCGHPAEALPLAQRAWFLAARFVERCERDTSVLLARVLLALDDYAGARCCAEELRCRTTAGVMPDAFSRMVELVLAEALSGAAPGEGSWAEVLTRVGRDDRLMPGDLLEVLYWRARMALGGGRRDEGLAALGAAGALLDDEPIWRARFSALVEDRRCVA